MPYAVAIWSGKRPTGASSADGSTLLRQFEPTVPVRVGVPPANGPPPVGIGESNAGAARSRRTRNGVAPATTSTFPRKPSGTCGCRSGSATATGLAGVPYTDHVVPNSRSSRPIVVCAMTRSPVMSTIPRDPTARSAARTGNALPDVVSVSYGVCEAQVAPFTAARTLVDRTLAAYASLGITVVVAAGDSGSSTCARGIPTKQLTAADKAPRVSWPASSPWVLAVGGTNLTLDPANGIASTGVWNDTTYPKPFTSLGAGGGGVSLLASRPAWQPATSFGRAGARLVPDVSAFADATPGYAIVCSANVDGCAQKRMGQTLAVVGGTSAAAPLVAGMIALWIEKARAAGLPRVGFVPPLLYSLAQSNPNAFTDITLGNNKIFDVSCCDARPGYDLASGIGSPRADAVADALPH